MINEGIWYMFNHIYAWTIPAILMVIVDAKHTIKPSLGVESCWFHRKTNIYDLNMQHRFIFSLKFRVFL